MKTYICTVTSNSTSPREYTVSTRSAMKCADMYGRAEGGEVVTVCNKSGRVLSRVDYYPGAGYVRVNP